MKVQEKLKTEKVQPSMIITLIILLLEVTRQKRKTLSVELLTFPQIIKPKQLKAQDNRLVQNPQS